MSTPRDDAAKRKRQRWLRRGLGIGVVDAFTAADFVMLSARPFESAAFVAGMNVGTSIHPGSTPRLATD